MGSTSPLRKVFKRRRAVKVPARAFRVASGRRLPREELERLGDEELRRRIHGDIVLPCRAAGVFLGTKGNHRSLPEEREEISLDSPGEVTTRCSEACSFKTPYFHLDEVREAVRSVPSFPLGIRIESGTFKEIAEERLQYKYFGNGEGICAVLLSGGAAEFRSDDLAATLFLPTQPATDKQVSDPPSPPSE